MDKIVNLNSLVWLLWLKGKGSNNHLGVLTVTVVHVGLLQDVQAFLQFIICQCMPWYNSEWCWHDILNIDVSLHMYSIYITVIHIIYKATQTRKPSRINAKETRYTSTQGYSDISLKCSHELCNVYTSINTYMCERAYMYMFCICIIPPTWLSNFKMWS